MGETKRFKGSSVVLVVGVVVVLAIVVALVFVVRDDDATDTAAVNPPGTVELPEPDVYESKDGELHLRVVAEEVTAPIAGVDYHGIFHYRTELLDDKGTFTPGTASPYIGAQWKVQPGDRIVVHYVNALPDALFQAVGESEPELIPQPINLHTHGLTVSPAGNSDNVLLAIPQGRSNRYVIDVPDDQYNGLYWYHPHIHGLTDDQVYAGLAGNIVVGRADGNYREFDDLPVHPMLIRYHVAEPGPEGQLMDASASNSRGTALEPRGTMHYTTNGELAPRIKLNAAGEGPGNDPESQVWAFTNVTGSATYVLALEEVDKDGATDSSVVGTPLDLTIVSIDGTPMYAPKVISGSEAARGYLLGQGGRVALLVQGPSDPSKVVRVVQVENRSGTGDASAHNWETQEYGPGWRDYTRDVLAVSYSDPDVPGRHVPTPTSLTPGYEVSPRPLDTQDVDYERTFVYNGVAEASATSPNNFPINFGLFPDNRLDQPRAGTVEEWTILNYSSLHHPFHVHTQYGQVMEIVSPVDPNYDDGPDEYPSVQYVTDLSQDSPAEHTQDLINLPPARVGPDGMPVLGPDGVPVEPGKIVVRVRFEDYLGAYVEHCHRLPHEDRGMMTLVRAIPHDPVYAITTPANGSGTQPATVTVVRSSDDQPIATVAPFGTDTPTVSTAVGDVDGDAVPDLAVASGGTMTTTVEVRSGASGYQEIIATYQPFDGDTTAASLSMGDLNGDARDEIVVGQGAGGRPRVVVFDAATGNRTADFDAYEPAFTGGVSTAVGMVEAGGRLSLLTAPGAGRAPTVKMFNFDLFGDEDGEFPDLHGALPPIEVASFDGADPDNKGGISVTTGYPYASIGGLASVLVTTSGAPGQLRAFTMSTDDGSHAIHGAHGEHGFSVTGVMRAHTYHPAGPRYATLVEMVDLGAADPTLATGAVTASLSDPRAATLLVVPVGGGAVTRWGLADDASGIVRQGELPHAGTAPSAL